MGSKFEGLRSKIAEELNISEEVITGISKVSVIGRNKIIIENHKGIIAFENNMVKIGGTEGTIVITGENFEMLFMGGSTLVIEGSFKEFHYGEES